MSAAVRRSAAESKRPRSGSALRIVTGIDRKMPKKRRSPDVASESDSDSRPQTPIDASDMRKSELASMFEGPDAGEHFAIFRLPPELAAACAAAADTTTQAAAGAGSGPGGSDQSPSKRRRVGRRSTGIRVYVKKFVHLSDVGLTLWPAAVLLTEQLLAEPELVRGRVCIELGCGVGLCSMVARAAGASCVYATDVSTAVLKLCERNVRHNGYMEGVRVRKLQWSDPGAFLSPARGPYGMSREDKVLLRRSSSEVVILASDPIVDDESASSFMSCIKQLRGRLAAQLKRVVFAWDQRVNCTVLRGEEVMGMAGLLGEVGSVRPLSGAALSGGETGVPEVVEIAAPPRVFSDGDWRPYVRLFEAKF